MKSKLRLEMPEHNLGTLLVKDTSSSEYLISGMASSRIYICSCTGARAAETSVIVPSARKQRVLSL